MSRRIKTLVHPYPLPLEDIIEDMKDVWSLISISTHEGYGRLNTWRQWVARSLVAGSLEQKRGCGVSGFAAPSSGVLWPAAEYDAAERFGILAGCTSSRLIKRSNDLWWCNSRTGTDMLSRQNCLRRSRSGTRTWKFVCSTPSTLRRFAFVLAFPVWTLDGRAWSPPLLREKSTVIWHPAWPCSRPWTMSFSPWSPSASRYGPTYFRNSDYHIM